MPGAPSCALGVTFFENTSDLNSFLHAYREAGTKDARAESQSPLDFTRRFTLTRNIYHGDAMKVMHQVSKHFKVNYLYRTEGGIDFRDSSNKNVRFNFAGKENEGKLFVPDTNANPDDLALNFTPGLPSIAWENNFNANFRGITDKNEARVVTLALVDHFDLIPFYQDFV